MAPSLLYCPACGAANTHDEKACYACQQLLGLPGDGDEPTHLLHKRYQMLSQVGTGGFGAVYKAWDTQAQNRLVAIKQINLRGLTPQEVIEATDGFNREVQMLSTLSHAHLPRIHAHFTDPEHWYVVMDFIDGETLEHYLRDITSSNENAIRELALDEVLDIGLQLCDVLDYLHTRQLPIIFRDLKPANLMRTSRGQLYLIDFGTARAFKPGQARDTIPLGSPGYAAPEQYGRAQTTPRSDIYSLGALLHHLLSRHDPSETPFTFAPLPLNGSTGLKELAFLVTRMVALDVEQRPTDIAEVKAALLHIRAQRSFEPRIWQPIPPGQAPLPVLARGAYLSPQIQQQMRAKAVAKKKSRRKFLVGGLGLTASLALGGFSFYHYWHPSLALASGFPRQITPLIGEVSTIAWSSDGQMVAFGLNNGTIVGNHFSQPNNSFALNNLFSLRTDTAQQLVSLLAWSPDHSKLAVVSDVGKIRVWNIDTGSGYPGFKGPLISTFSPTAPVVPGAGNIKAMAWSPDNQRLAVVDDQKRLFLCNALTGSASLFGDATWSSGKVGAILAWSPDGRFLAVQREAPANTVGSGTLEILEAPLGLSQTSIALNASQATVLAWSPDGQHIAVLSIDGTLQVWESQNQHQQVFSQQIATQQNQLVWSPDSRFLATIDDANNLLLLDRSNGSTLTSAPITDSSGAGSSFSGQALAWLSDNQHIAVANNNIECWLWRIPWL